jgi:hypothetical protein
MQRNLKWRPNLSGPMLYNPVQRLSGRWPPSDRPLLQVEKCPRHLRRRALGWDSCVEYHVYPATQASVSY